MRTCGSYETIVIDQILTNGTQEGSMISFFTHDERCIKPHLAWLLLFALSSWIAFPCAAVSILFFGLVAARKLYRIATLLMICAWLVWFVQNVNQKIFPFPWRHKEKLSHHTQSRRGACQPIPFKRDTIVFESRVSWRHTLPNAAFGITASAQSFCPSAKVHGPCRLMVSLSHHHYNNTVKRCYLTIILAFASGFDSVLASKVTKFPGSAAWLSVGEKAFVLRSVRPGIRIQHRVPLDNLSSFLVMFQDDMTRPLIQANAKILHCRKVLEL